MIQPVRAPVRRQLSALFILIGWTSAVLVCAIKPLAHCGPNPNAETSHHELSDDHHHEAGSHQDGKEHQHDGDEEDAGSNSTCADDPSCKAIYSALNTTFPTPLEVLAATLLYDVNQLSTIVILHRPVCDSATSKERVLLLTHGVCTCVNSLPLAPPSA